MLCNLLIREIKILKDDTVGYYYFMAKYQTRLEQLCVVHLFLGDQIWVAV